MKGRKFVWPLFLLLFFTAKSSAQNFEDLAQSLSRYNSSTLQEKIFVHTDKDFYVAGEIIWFKVYQVDGVTNKPLHISKVVYIEIIDADKKPILQAKVGAKNGLGDGAISLPTATETGNYIFRAYTSWMKNFAADFYFQKEITIVNTFKKPDWKKFEVSKQYSAHFFPEGGNLVAGIENRVAFKIVDASGKGVEGKGFVIDSGNDTVASFKTQHAGMGSFDLNPLSVKTYKAVVATIDGAVVVAELPAVYEQGYVLKLSAAEKEKLAVKISLKGMNDRQVYLLVHSRQQVKISEVKPVQNGSAFFEVDVEKLGEGISHFTLFNERRQPVSERLYFKQPTDELKINISQQKKTYLQREKIKLQVQTEKSTSANISVAVYRLDSLHQFGTENIRSYLLLRSDMAGPVENASYYFEHPDDTSSIDLLMLTSGWRRFAWNDILTNSKPAFQFIPEYEGQIIKGNVTDRNGNALTDIAVQLSLPDSNFDFVHSRTGKDGDVQFPVKIFTGIKNIVVQSGKQQGFRFSLHSPFSNKFSSCNTSPFHLSETMLGDIQVAHQAMQVQNIYTSTRQFFSTPENSYTPFYTEPDKEYRLDEYTRFPSMEEVLKEFVTEVRMRGQKESPVLNVLNAPFKTFFDLPPLILVDGVAVPNPANLLALDPLNVKKIDVIAQKYHYRSMTNNGIISFRTYKGDMGGLELDANAIVLEYESLQEKRIFYSPSYDTEQLKQSRLPDFRTVLYWSPNAQIVPGEITAIDFFASDIKGKYLVVAEGLSNDGKPGTGTAFFEVVK